MNDPDPHQDPYQISMEEACLRFPEAMVLFDVQCSHLLDHRPDLIRLRTYGKRGTYASGGGGIRRDRLGAVAGHLRAIWHRDVGVWVRASFGVSSKPYVADPPQTEVQTVWCESLDNGWHNIINPLLLASGGSSS